MNIYCKNCGNKIKNNIFNNKLCIKCKRNLVNKKRREYYHKIEKYRKKEYYETKVKLNHEKVLLKGAQNRANKNNLKFLLDINDIIIPKKCPVLGIDLFFSEKRTENTPSIDRIDPNKGYTYDNIKIISWKANRLKNNMTLDECYKIYEYIKKNKSSE